MKKRAVAAALAASFVLGAGMTALADGTLQDITAQLNYGINILYNGQPQTMADANGNRVYPISYNGTTYVPIRAVSNIFGESVNWDGATNTVYLGSSEKQPLDLTKQISTGTEHSWKIVDANELKLSGSDANSTYNSGIQYKIWNGVASVSLFSIVPLDVNGYTKVSFTVWSDIDATIFVTDENAKTITSFDITAGSIVSKEIDISGHDKIAFAANAKKTTQTGTAKFLNPTAK